MPKKQDSLTIDDWNKLNEQVQHLIQRCGEYESIIQSDALIVTGTHCGHTLTSEDADQVKDMLEKHHEQCVLALAAHGIDYKPNWSRNNEENKR